MVLLDNYLVMHGRCPFEGTRLHAVSWFKSVDLSLNSFLLHFTAHFGDTSETIGMSECE